ncbi:MAG: restriction endonuclease subunit S [Caldilineaceae bacterium]|nr:restriction endonuclease subunit S [Caldilineaceae bacterium]
MRSKSVIDAVSASTFGAKMPRADWQFIGGMKYPFPPFVEQRAIVRYLDHVDRRIQRYIEAKEKLIALLQEARQSIIQRSVTRGIDPDVPFKPSGVEGLGDVPAHWEVRRAKYLYHEVNERSSTGAEELMSVSHKTGVTPRKKNVTMFRAETNVGYKLCRPGDIVVNTMWAYMAALGVARQVGLVSPSYNVYRPIAGEEMNLDYIDPLLRTETYRTEYLVRSTGITVSRLRLYPESFLDIPLLYPPVEEQAAIAAYLEKATADIDAAIDNARRQVEFMTEYRTSLIAHVVTGKLDVRAAAEQLPQEARELTAS